MPNKYTKILPGNQSHQVQLKTNTSEAGILSFFSINEWNKSQQGIQCQVLCKENATVIYGEIKRKMRDHSPFVQERIRAKARVQKLSC